MTAVARDEYADVGSPRDGRVEMLMGVSSDTDVQLFKKALTCSKDRLGQTCQHRRFRPTVNYHPILRMKSTVQ
jgi:hypothetical protein